MPPVRGSILAWLALILLPAAAPALGPFPGGLLDETGQTAFLSGRARIDAVALSGGELLWSTSDAQVPLLLAGDRLYGLALGGSEATPPPAPPRSGEGSRSVFLPLPASGRGSGGGVLSQPLSQGNVLYVRGFDLANKGKRIYQSARIELPRWVTTAEMPGRSFHWTWRREKAVLFLNWQAAAWAETGPRKQGAGEVRIDLEAGTVKMEEVSLPASPVDAGDTRPIPQRIAGLAVRWHRGIGGHLYALVLEETAGAAGQRKQRLVLRTWNEETGKEESAHELAVGRRLVVLAGLDGFHLWLRDAAPSPDEVGSRDAPAGGYQWAVYSVLDGHLVARVPFVPGTQQAMLLDHRAYFLTSAPLKDANGDFTRRILALLAVDVESGKLRWQRSLSIKALAP